MIILAPIHHQSQGGVLAYYLVAVKDYGDLKLVDDLDRVGDDLVQLQTVVPKVTVENLLSAYRRYDLVVKRVNAENGLEGDFSEAFTFHTSEDGNYGNVWYIVFICKG